MTCSTPGCQGHLGKFDNCLDEALYAESLDGNHETTGDVDAHGYITLMIVEEPYMFSFGDGRTLRVPAGNFLLIEDSNGFVYTQSFDSVLDVRDAFEVAESEYAQWLGQDD